MTQVMPTSIDAISPVCVCWSDYVSVCVGFGCKQTQSQDYKLIQCLRVDSEFRIGNWKPSSHTFDISLIEWTHQTHEALDGSGCSQTAWLVLFSFDQTNAVVFHPKGGILFWCSSHELSWRTILWRFPNILWTHFHWLLFSSSSDVEEVNILISSLFFSAVSWERTISSLTLSITIVFCRSIAFPSPGLLLRHLPEKKETFTGFSTLIKLVILFSPSWLFVNKNYRLLLNINSKIKKKIDTCRCHLLEVYI